MNDWERFRKYARRVRTLVLNEQEDKTIVSKEAFDEISRTRVTLNILPNLRHLTWVTTSVERMRLSLMFQHENITDFTVFLHTTPTYPISTFFKEVMLRMPKLKELDLRFSFPASKAEGDFIELFRGLARLKKIVLPLYTLTSKIVEELSTLRELTTIQFEFMESQGRGDIADVVAFNPQLRAGAFPALEDLSLSVLLVDMTRFISGSFAPSNLTSLYAHTISQSSPEEVSAFLTAVAENCQLLTRLYLDFFTSSDIGTDLRQPCITWENLRPVLSCSNLVEFEVRWDKAFQLTQDDVEEMAMKWPSLETLNLNCEPMYLNVPPSLDLRALIPFARHCPKILELGLYIDAGADVDIAAQYPPLVPFRSLQRLLMGNSPIRDYKKVALFLSQLCPLGCEVVAGVTWPDGFILREDDLMTLTMLESVSKTVAKWFADWSEVNRALSMLIELRMEERAQRAALERELDDRRIRDMVREDRMAVAGNTKLDRGCIIS